MLVGGEDGGRLTGGMDRQLRRLAWSLVAGQRFRGFLNKERGVVLEQVADLIESGAVTPRLDRSYPLDRAQDATRAREAGDVRGKVALVV